MRSLCVPFCLLAVLALTAGCEDGPNQTYSPASGTVAPSADAAVASGSQGFDAGYPTSGKTTLCSTDFKRQRWAWMLTQPVKPPRFYAGIDLAGSDAWNGLSIGQAEAPPGDPNAADGGLCQSAPLGAGGTCPSGFGACDQNVWGNNGEVSFSWNVATHLIDQMQMNLGYTGPLKTASYPDHTGTMHAYTLAIGDVVRRDGQPFLLPWTGNPAQEITDIFNAIMASYATGGGIAWDTSACTSDTTCTNSEVCQCQHAVDGSGTPTADCASGSKGQCGDADCSTDGYCLVYPPQWIFGIRPLAFYVQGTAGVPQPALSTPTAFYNFWVKWEPFSNLPQTVELGATGPVASGTPIGVPKGKSTTCTQQIGTTFADFTANCVQVHGDANNPNGTDVVNLSKVLNGLTHDQEHWTANVQGVNQNFTSLTVANDPNAVVLDKDTPKPGDVAQDFTYDLRARGHVSNDYNAKNQKDLRGSTLVFVEWARLLLADVARLLGRPTAKKLGDPTCTGFDASGEPNYKNTTGCSGIEGLIVPGHGSIGDFSLDPRRPDLNPSNNWDNAIGWYPGSIIKAGALTGALCIDPVAQTDCTAAVSPQGAVSIWDNMLNHVTRVLGNGNVLSLPSEMQDRRYYFKFFGLAFVKYLKAYGNYPLSARDSFPTGVMGGGLGPSDVAAQAIDQESLFFDYTVQPGVGGAQTFDKFEYVDRDFVGKGSGGTYNYVPWDFEYGTDILGGNQRYDNWYRRMDREELGLYASMLTDKTHTPGQENNVNITNLAGSSLLTTVWPSYACATGQYSDPTAATGNGCNGTYPPLDPANPSGLVSCAATGACAGGKVCVQASTFESGAIAVCANPCDYAAHPTSGCGPTQACVLSGKAAGCVDMKMDRNGPSPCTDPVTGAPVTCAAPSVVTPHPLLWYYPGAWARTPFALGHSPITLAAADKHPDIGVAKIAIPNFKAGPYTISPIAAGAGDGGAACPAGYDLGASKVWCNAQLNGGSGTLSPSFTPLTPWFDVGTGQTPSGGPIGFAIPQDGQRDQFVTTGQLDFTGVLESYVVDYVPYPDPERPSCITDDACNPGFTCNPNSHLCQTDDDTIRIQAVEGADFLGQAFLCQDAATGDVLHVGMFDSASAILDWFAAHPGTSANANAGGGIPSAQTQCSVVVRSSGYHNAVSQIASLTNGIVLNFGGGQGQGRVTDIVLFDTTLIQSF